MSLNLSRELGEERLSNYMNVANKRVLTTQKIAWKMITMDAESPPITAVIKPKNLISSINEHSEQTDNRFLIAL